MAKLTTKCLHIVIGVVLISYAICLNSYGLTMKTNENNNKIITIAGSQEAGYEGDGGSAFKAKLNQPKGIVIGKDDNIYFADSNNNVIRKIDKTTGIITTIAGNFKHSDLIPKDYLKNLNGMSAAKAVFYHPECIAIDNDLNIYITDQSNNLVEKVNVKNGKMSIVAGNGLEEDTNNKGIATETSLNMPSGIAIDKNGDLLIADSNNHVIRKVDLKNGTICNFVNNSNVSNYTESDINAIINSTDMSYSDKMKKIDQIFARPDDPYYICLGKNGDIYYDDDFMHMIKKADSTGKTSIIAGTEKSGNTGDGGNAADAKFNTPSQIAVDNEGNLYIADTNNNRIRKIDIKTGVISTVAGSNAFGYSGDGKDAKDALLNSPEGVAVDSKGNIYITDTNNNCIREIVNNTLEK